MRCNNAGVYKLTAMKIAMSITVLWEVKPVDLSMENTVHVKLWSSTWCKVL